MDSARIHLAHVPPPFCSACHNPKPQSRFVDFDAAYEGPSFAAGDDTDVAGAMAVTSDDLILCEDCVRAAAQLVDMGDVDQLKQQLEEADEERERMSDRLAAQSAHIGQLEKAAASRVALDTAMGRQQDAQEAPPTPQRTGATTRGGGRGRSASKRKVTS